MAARQNKGTSTYKALNVRQITRIGEQLTTIGNQLSGHVQAMQQKASTTAGTAGGGRRSKAATPRARAAGAGNGE